MKLDEFIELLVNTKQKKNEIILFCGAGISRDSGLPSANHFDKYFSKNQERRDEFKNSLDKKTIFWRNLLSRFTYSNNHIDILRLMEHDYLNTIITSNYDMLFEQCIKSEFDYWIDKACDNENCIEKSYLIEDTNEKNTECKKLIKIHGDVEQSDIEKIKLDMGIANEIKDSKEIWNKVFSKDKILWVIGYAGKVEDPAFNFMKESSENKNISKIIWMYVENDKNELDRIEEYFGKDNIEFIKILSAREVFENINKKIFGDEVDTAYNKQLNNCKEDDGIKTVEQAMEISYDTINLLEKVDYGIVKEMQNAEEKFNEVLSEGGELDDSTELYVLRRYNSYTPILPRKEDESKGGGYFLTHKGKGIVIDPGYDFLDNFLNYKGECKCKNKQFRLNNIDAIVITHAHNDHYGELDVLQNMIFQYNKRLKIKKKLYPYIKRAIEMNSNDMNEEAMKKLIYSIKNIIEDFPMHKEANIAINLMKNKLHNETIEKDDNIRLLKDYTKELPQEKKIDLFVTLSVFKAIDGLIHIERNQFNKIYILNPGESVECINKHINITATRAKHFDMYSKNYSIGLIFNLENDRKIIKIGFTGDTGYYAGLAEQYKECNVLVPHIGSIKPKELLIYSKNNCEEDEIFNRFLNEKYHIPKFDSQNKETVFYENHLGILGLVSLISSLKSDKENALKLVVISEYGEEMKNFRHKVTEWLNEVYKEHKDFKILTGDVGLTINLSDVINNKCNIEEKIEVNKISYIY